MANKTHEFRLMMEPEWIENYKNFCIKYGYTMSGFARAAINKRLTEEKFIRDQSTNNQEKGCGGALNGSESNNKSKDEINDKNCKNH